MTNRNRAQAALNRIIAVVGEDEAIKIWIKGITARHPRMDLIADQGEALADEIEWRTEVNAQMADHADELDTQQGAIC